MIFLGFDVVKTCLINARPKDPVPPVMRIVLPFKSQLGSLKVWIVASLKTVYSNSGTEMPSVYFLKLGRDKQPLDFNADAITDPRFLGVLLRCLLGRFNRFGIIGNAAHKSGSNVSVDVDQGNGFFSRRIDHAIDGLVVDELAER